MKKKILIIVPILIVALIVIIAIPKHNNNDIEETPQEVSETPEVSEPEPEITPEPEKEKTLRQEKGITQFNAKQGLVAGHEVQETTEPEEVTDKIVAETQAEAEYVDYVQDQASENNKDESDKQESDIEPLDKVMYATGNINTRSGPSVDFTKVGGLTVNQEVHVTGQSKTTGWYEIEVDGAKQYVSDKLLSDNKVEVSKPSSNNNGGGGSTTSGGNGGNADINARVQEALKQLGVDPSKDISQDVAAPAPTPGGHRSSGEGIEFY